MACMGRSLSLVQPELEAGPAHLHGHPLAVFGCLYGAAHRCLLLTQRGNSDLAWDVSL